MHSRAHCAAALLGLLLAGLSGADCLVHVSSGLGIRLKSSVCAKNTLNFLFREDHRSFSDRYLLTDAREVNNPTHTELVAI